MVPGLDSINLNSSSKESAIPASNPLLVALDLTAIDFTSVSTVVTLSVQGRLKKMGRLHIHIG